MGKKWQVNMKIFCTIVILAASIAGISYGQKHLEVLEKTASEHVTSTYLNTNNISTIFLQYFTMTGDVMLSVVNPVLSFLKEAAIMQYISQVCFGVHWLKEILFLKLEVLNI